MTEKLLHSLKDKYPKLLSNLHYGFECGDGWYALIDELCAKLTELIDKKPNVADYDIDFYATQIKEKYGTLCFYMSVSTDQMDKLIDEAEAKSITICEVCGKPGEISQGPWYEVRCDGCR